MWSVHGSMVCEVVCEVVVVRRDTSVRSGRVLAVDGRRSIIIDARNGSERRCTIVFRVEATQESRDKTNLRICSHPTSRLSSLLGRYLYLTKH